MKTLATLAILFAMLGGVMAQPGLSTRSYSGQFLVRAPAFPADPTLVTKLTAGGDYVQLDAALLVISCERIKQLLWRRLEGQPSWNGKILIRLRAAREGDDRVSIVSEKFSDGWRYRVQLPDVMRRDRFVSTIVQVLLLEMANRHAEERSTEIPQWLVEGLSREVLIAGGTAGELQIFIPPAGKLKVFLPPPKTVVRTWEFNEPGLNANERRTNALYWAHGILTSQPPLTFGELSWPSDSQVASAVYQGSAQLFVARLLELPDGPASLRNLVGRLSRQLNWQLVFLDAFPGHFQTMLDVEKWWAVQVAHFTGRELTQTWSSAESWRKLDEILRPSVQVRTGADTMPVRAEMDLPTVLREVKGIEQTQFCRQKLQALDFLRLRAAPDMVGLVDDYRQAITTYLQWQTGTNPFRPLRWIFGLTTNRAATELIRQLNLLEVRREALRPVSPPADAQEPDGVLAAVR